jgi:flagellar FliL protein
LYALNKERLREKVITEIRNSEVGDLEEAGLGLIKRRVLKISNDLLGKQLLREIIFTDYTFVEL